MSNNEILENLTLNTAIRNAYVLKVKKEMEKTYKTKSIPLNAIIIYMENFIKKIGGNDITVELITKGIKDWFNDDVTLKY